MLTATLKSGNQKVEARDVTKLDGPFSCPICKSKVILHKGLVKVDHFKHAAADIKKCAYGAHGSESTRNAILSVFDSLKDDPRFKSVELEHTVDDLRIDILLRKSSVSLAIDFQAIHLNEITLPERVEKYTKLGLPVLWLLPFREELLSDRMSLRTYEKWLHAFHYGRVYYHLKGADIIPVHLGDIHKYVEGTDFGGGYERKLKAYKRPIIGPKQSIATDLTIKSGEAWVFANYHLPKARRAVGREGKFWNTLKDSGGIKD